MRTIRSFNDVMMAHTAKAVLDCADIGSKVLGDNLSMSGGPEFGLNYVQLVIFDDTDEEKANEILRENGFS